MGKLFEKLCKGPAVVIDDRIGDEKDLINKLIGEIKDNNVPVICYKSPYEVKNELTGLLFSNFIVLDWKFAAGGDSTIGVITGDEAEMVAEQEVIELIKELKKICLAPIFILSAFDKDWIVSKLRTGGIATEGKDWIFIENKDVLCETTGNLISKIEDWIQGSPHIYLAKCWTNEWLSKNTAVFWDLYELNSNWPALFYRSFEEDGEDPILALRDTLFQMIFSEIDVSKVESSFINKEIEEIDEESQKESLENLYKRLVYITKDIDKDIRPGDIFKKTENNKATYYLNIRPECDTTKRKQTENGDIMLYLLEGHARRAKDMRDRYDEKRSLIIPWADEIILINLDKNPIVRFSKKDLITKWYSEMQSYKKICRVIPPWITEIRQSYSNYLLRIGTPSYPDQIVDSVFESKEESS